MYWSAVPPCSPDTPAPPARSKHSATLVGGCVYLLGGRNGNLPLKDLWKYDLASGVWAQLQPIGDKPPSLQEHTVVAHKECLYVFGGEVGFSAGTETPLWVYDVRRNSWRKVRTPKGVAVPRGRRGHTALLHRGAMLIYGGYQDLRGSSSELWAFHFETESWHLLSSNSIATASSKSGSASSDSAPPARHKHSAIIHDDAMWVYGGMTDLQERSDLWKWDTVSSTWSTFKLKINPGPLHSHAVCKLPGSMLIFGGESNGHPTNDLWKFNFALESWEKLQTDGLKPQPRSESCAFAVSELQLQPDLTAALPADNISCCAVGATQATTTSSVVRPRPRTSSSVDRTSRHSSYLPNNRVSPFEKTYTFLPTTNNYIDGSDESFHQSLVNTTQNTYRSAQPNSFLREIQKLSQLNLSRLSQYNNNNKCSYSVLQSDNNDSQESLLHQYASGQDETSSSATPVRSSLVKSQSAHVINRSRRTIIQSNTVSPGVVEANNMTCQPAADGHKPALNSRAAKTDNVMSSKNFEMTREPISVPNFSTLILPTPVLTPVEAARLVFLDTDDENDEDLHSEAMPPPPTHEIINVQPAREMAIYENFKPALRDESFNSHVGAPIYQNVPKSTSIKFKQYPELEEVSDENSTSDYASIEAVNRLSSISNARSSPPGELEQYNVAYEKNVSYAGWTSRSKIRTPIADGQFGFCNPNYLGPDIQILLGGNGRHSWHVTDSNNGQKAQQYAKLLNTPDSGVDDSSGRSNSRQLFGTEEMVEMKRLDKTSESEDQSKPKNIDKTCSGKKVPPNFLPLDGSSRSPRLRGGDKSRASSASRAERQREKRVVDISNEPAPSFIDTSVPLYVFIVGGKEQGQITVFKRPISVWKLRLY